MFSLGLLMLFCLLPLTGCDTTPKGNWYRGNTHTHTFWSDGNDFPDMTAKWYKDNGYQFLVLSDHNILSDHEKWMHIKHINRRSGNKAYPRYTNTFSPEWIETRGEDDNLEVRLKTLKEMKQKFEAPEQFLMIQGEEITDRFGVAQIHTNAVNLVEQISPQRGKSVRETMRNNLIAVIKQSEKYNKPMFAHLNHPNFHYSITAEDIAHVVEEQFFEVYNGHTGVHNEGDHIHASTDRMWDIANTIRLIQLNAPPLFGVATDDAHHYHGNSNVSVTGRGWIMVRAPKLEPDTLVNAINAGDFYASSGVTLKHYHYEPDKRRLTIAVDEKPGTRYSIKFIGTFAGTDMNPKDVLDKNGKPIVDANGRPLRLTKRYSEHVGMTLKEVKGSQGVYILPPNLLYVRALITSNTPHPKPTFKGEVERAWTQPVGWETHIAEQN